MFKKEIKLANDRTVNKKKLEKECLNLWQQIIKLRAGNKCEFYRCNKTAEHYKLDAHHIFSKGTHKHLKFDVDNGLCLCILNHTFGKEAAHTDPNFLNKILGRIDGYKAIRTEQWFTLLERKAWSVAKLDLKLEEIYLKQELKKYANKQQSKNRNN